MPFHAHTTPSLPQGLQVCTSLVRILDHCPKGPWRSIIKLKCTPQVLGREIPRACNDNSSDLERFQTYITAPLSGGAVELILNILGGGRWVGGVAKAYFFGLFQYSITDTPVSVRSRIKVTSSHPSSPTLFNTSEVDVVPPTECLIK